MTLVLAEYPACRRGMTDWCGTALILALLPAAPGQVWADVGAGAHSVFAYGFAARRGCRIVGVDITDRLTDQMDRARRAGLVGEGQVSWLRGDARKLPLADGSLDGVVAVSALEHLTAGGDDAVALREIHRVLRPGGRAVVTVPFRAAGSAIELRGRRPASRSCCVVRWLVPGQEPTDGPVPARI